MNTISTNKKLGRMASKYTEGERQEKLVASFNVVACWSKEQAQKPELQGQVEYFVKLASLSEQLARVARSLDPAKSLRDGGCCNREAIGAVASLEAELHQKPKGDLDRNNQELRTALRRINEFRNDGYHYALCG